MRSPNRLKSTLLLFACTAQEVAKLQQDIEGKGLNLVVFGEWYNQQTLEKTRFFDDNTRSWWRPVTGEVALRHAQTVARRAGSCRSAERQVMQCCSPPSRSITRHLMNPHMQQKELYQVCRNSPRSDPPSFPLTQ